MFGSSEDAGTNGCVSETALMFGGEATRGKRMLPEDDTTKYFIVPLKGNR